MLLDGAPADREDLADLPAGFSLRRPLQHLAFARRQSRLRCGRDPGELAHALIAVKRYQMDDRVAASGQVEVAARHGHAGLEAMGRVDRHRESLLEAEVCPTTHELRGARVRIIVILRRGPFERLARATTPPRYRIETDEVVADVKVEEFGRPPRDQYGSLELRFRQPGDDEITDAIAVHDPGRAGDHGLGVRQCIQAGDEIERLLVCLHARHSLPPTWPPCSPSLRHCRTGYNLKDLFWITVTES